MSDINELRSVLESIEALKEKMDDAYAVDNAPHVVRNYEDAKYHLGKIQSIFK